MADDSVALALRFAEALSSGETERVLACVDPEVRFEPGKDYGERQAALEAAGLS